MCAGTTTIRPARPDDAPVLAALAGELGYPTTANEVAARLEDPDLEVLVAEAGGEVVAWVDIADRTTLYGGRNAEIQGLVITAARRRSGVGLALVEAAEAWARARGIDAIRVRSRSDREGARAFYLGLGFDIVKSQTVFEKRL